MSHKIKSTGKDSAPLAGVASIDQASPVTKVASVAPKHEFNEGYIMSRRPTRLSLELISRAREKNKS